MNAVNALLRPDLQAIQGWVAPNSRVLDLGCGDGLLLHHLVHQKNSEGYGIEINPDNIEQCIARGINVLEYDLNSGLTAFSSQSFDLVIMTQALQAVKSPDLMLEEMLRIGKESIITFPNFGHWRCRTNLLTSGRMPETKSLPYHWYNTPNIHLCTFKDFEALCKERKIKVINRTVVDHAFRDSLLMQLFPNFFGEVAIYHVTR